MENSNIVMGNKRKYKTRKNIQFSNNGTYRDMYTYAVTIIWKDGAATESIVNEEMYNRWIEGLDANISYKVEQLGREEYIHINAVKVIYPNGIVNEAVARNYVEKTQKKLTEFKKNNGIIVKNVKAARGIIDAVILLIVVVGAAIIINSGVIETGNFDTKAVEQSLLAVHPVIIMALGSIYFFVFYRKKVIIKRRLMILFSILGMCGISVATYLWLGGVFLIMSIGYAAAFVMYFVYCLVRGFKNERSHTVWKFQVMQIIETPEINQKDIFLACLNGEGEAIRYPFIKYSTKLSNKYNQGEIFCIEIKKISELKLYTINPNYWFFDISYLGEEDILKSNTGRAIIRI